MTLCNEALDVLLWVVTEHRCSIKVKSLTQPPLIKIQTNKQSRIGTRLPAAECAVTAQFCHSHLPPRMAITAVS